MSRKDHLYITVIFFITIKDHLQVALKFWLMRGE